MRISEERLAQLEYRVITCLQDPTYGQLKDLFADLREARSALRHLLAAIEADCEQGQEHKYDKDLNAAIAEAQAHVSSR